MTKTTLTSGTSRTIASANTYFYYFGTDLTLTNAGNIINPTTGLTNDVDKMDGIDLENAGDTLINTGKISAGQFGVNLVAGGTGAATLSNFGTILGGQGAVNIDTPGGVVINQSNGLIAGQYSLAGGTGFNQAAAGVTLVAAGTVINYGRITTDVTNSNYPSAVIFADGSGAARLTNASSGTITGQVYGALGNTISPTVVNSGKIFALDKYAAVALYAGGSVTNLSGGTIDSTAATSIKIGVYIKALAGTVTNAGTIIGGSGADAVKLAAVAGNRVILETGAVFTGDVDGGTTATLELGASYTATGTLSSFGSKYLNFSQIKVDSGASWQWNSTDTMSAGITLTNAGTLVSDASLTLASAGSLINNGVILLDAGTLTPENFSGSGTIAFGTATGDVLALTSANSSINIVGNMKQGQTIEILGKSITSANLLAGNTLALGFSGGVVDVKLTPGQSFSGDFFHSAAGTNSFITENTTPCYLAGTRIRTDHGEILVEDLAIGDLVITLDGSARPIKWIGRRAYASAFAIGNRDVIPILIKQSALGDNVPARDLYVSPLHAMFIGDVLVAAEHLVNGVTILRCPEIDPIRYFHIELDQHDVIFAEGAPAETFVDCDSRGMFHNATEFARLYPGDDAPRWMFCAPRIEGGLVLEGIRGAIDARAGLVPVSGEIAPGALHGMVDGMDGATLTGWAFDPTLPDRPVTLEVLDGDGLIAHVVANRYRSDLETAGIGDGRHGFELRLSRALSPLRRHEMRVRRAADGHELAGSPLVIEQLDAPALLSGAREAIGFALNAAGDAPAMDGLLETLLHSIDDARRLRCALRPAADDGAGLLRAAATPRRQPKRALVIDDRLPRADRDAGSNAILSHVAVLRTLGWEVAFVASHDLSADAAAMAPLLALGATCYAAPAVSSVEEVLRRNRNAFDLVYLHRLSNAEAYAGLARAWQSRAQVVYSVADLHHVRTGRQALAHREAELLEDSRRLKQREIAAMRMADAVITHSPAEAAYLGETAPGLNVHVVPWAVRAAPREVAFGARHGIAFIGGMRHAPNLDAVRWLASEIMPLVWARERAIGCMIVGGDWIGPLGYHLDPRIELTGPIDTLGSVFDRVRLTVAPLFGAGIKGKVLDSLAAGVPCVMTPVAAEGIPLDEVLRAAVTGDPAEMAALILDLHQRANLNGAHGDAGMALVRQHYAEDRVIDAMAEAVGAGTPVSLARVA